MKNIIALISLFLIACATQIDTSNTPKLVIVTPTAWRSSLDKYIDLKTNKGIYVDVINVESIEKTGDSSTWGENLHHALIEVKPDYVFLVGDMSVVPTIFACSDITWSPWTTVSCTYSDYYMSLSSDKVPLFPIGRLMAQSTIEIDNYYTKLLTYELIYGSPAGAYMLNDRDYDPSDNTVIGYANQLRAIGTPTNVETLNTFDHKDVNNGIIEATYNSIELAVDNVTSFMLFFGHGASWGWGYHGNILWPWLNFSNTKPVPFVYAMACETALSGPNPPWYPYYDSNNTYKNFSAWDYNVSGPILRSDMGLVSSLQYNDVITNSIARTFTSTTTFGAMVYIGETVVTSAEYDLNAALMANIVDAYQNNTTIGDIWLKTEKSGAGHPEYFQFVGDPSTEFITK